MKFSQQYQNMRTLSHSHLTDLSESGRVCFQKAVWEKRETRFPYSSNSLCQFTRWLLVLGSRAGVPRTAFCLDILHSTHTGTHNTEHIFPTVWNELFCVNSVILASAHGDSTMPTKPSDQFTSHASSHLLSFWSRALAIGQHQLSHGESSNGMFQRKLSLPTGAEFIPQENALLIYYLYQILLAKKPLQCLLRFPTSIMNSICFHSVYQKLIAMAMKSFMMFLVAE